MSSTDRQLLQPGTIGIIPTDTVYGVVARAADQTAAERLYRLKARDDKPGTVIAADLKQLEDLGLKHRYVKAVEQFWPGPVSVVIPVADPRLAYLHRGKMSLAVRIPDDAKLLELLTRTGPLLTSSANPSGQPVAADVAQAKNYFGDKVDFYVDGGDLSNRQPSTIVRVIDDAVEILRPGAAKIRE